MGRLNVYGLSMFSQLLSAAIRPSKYYHTALVNKPERPVFVVALLAIPIP
jgi:hypothetical protein